MHESLGENVHFRYSSEEESNYFTKAQPDAYECGVDHDEMGFHYHPSEHNHRHSKEKEKAQAKIENFVAGTLTSFTVIDLMIVYTTDAELLADRFSSGIDFAMAQAMNLSQTALSNGFVYEK